MAAARLTLGLAVLVTVAVVLSSLGLVGAVAPAAPRASGNATPASHFTALSSGPSAPSGSTAGFLSSHAPSSPTSPVASPAPSSAESNVLAELSKLHVPLKYAYLPNLNANPNPALVHGHVAPGYGGGAPAPLGVADYGLTNFSGTITPGVVSTPSVHGTYTPVIMNGLSADVSGPDEYGVQLNAVLNNVQLFGTPGYQFWTQNVVDYSTYSHQLFFVSNIWNFSARGGEITPNIFYQIGPNATVAAPSYYYGLGGPITISYPFVLNLYLNSTVIAGRDAVFFNFTLGNTPFGGTQFYAGSYDYAIFSSTVSGGAAAPTPAYVANGLAYNPIGLTDDFELTIGGPGGGSNFDILAANAYFGLQYWNTTTSAYEVVPSAYNWGSETGETSIGGYVMWGYEPAPYTQFGGPNTAYMSQGPSVLQGLWNVSGQGGALGSYGDFFHLNLAPSNAFVFVAPGNVYSGLATTNWSLFQWAPNDPGTGYELYPGVWTFVFVQANYDPTAGTLTLVGYGGSVSSSLTMNPDQGQGVYTPLWALNNSGLANITVPAVSPYTLFNNQYLPLGQIGTTTFPWFSQVNDYLFPVFPGIFLYNTSTPVFITSPPSLTVNYNGAVLAELKAAGFPTSNQLQMLFWNSSSIELANGANIGGWFYAGAYFGPADSAYNVVFWNSTGDTIFGNHFNTGSDALYMYGGTENLIFNNTFTQSIPVVGSPGGTVAGSFGAVGLFEADYGEGSTYAGIYGGNGSWQCFDFAFCDVVFNNIFLTPTTAVSPQTDPYYFYVRLPSCPAIVSAIAVGTCYFDDAWNIENGVEAWTSNIIGGPNLGGNYWWNYGISPNPYNYLPYDAFNFGAFGVSDIYYNGDYLPLTTQSLYAVSFEETGLPASTYWYAYTSLGSAGEEFGGSFNTFSNLTLTNGTYGVDFFANDPNLAAPGISVTVNGADLLIHISFLAAYVITFAETGLVSGTYWWAYVYNASFGYVGSVSSTGNEANFTRVMPGTYYYDFGSTSAWFAANPSSGSDSVTGNVTVPVTFEPLHTFTWMAHNLPANTWWTIVIQNATESYTGTTTGGSLTFYGFTGSYTWTAVANGFVASPATGSTTLAANATQNITFAAPATLTFTESGLASGAGWTVWLTQNGVTTAESSTTSTIQFAAVDGTYNYTVSAPGYTPSGSTGTGTLPTNNAVTVSFTAVPGTLSIAVATAGSTTWVNGATVTTPYSQTLAPGTYSVEVQKSGYETYYNNVTVTSGKTASLAVTLTANPSSPSGSSSSSNGISTEAWILIAVLAVLALAFLAMALYFRSRGRSPPPSMAPYQGTSGSTGTPPASGGSPPSSGATTPAWSEGQGPSSPPPGAS